MNVSLDDILALAGRLDDAPGFDTPRERFRRFLLAQVTDPASARSLIDQSQHSVGEQHHRALQDTVVTLGRFLGFETAFGNYQRVPGVPKSDGHWRARRRLEIVVDVLTDQTPRGDVDDLSRALSALAPPNVESDVRHLGLCIVTPMYGGRARLEDPFFGERLHPDLRIASLSSVLWMAEAVAAGRLSHHDVVRLMSSGAGLDFIVDLMAQVAAGGHDARSSIAPTSAAAPAAAPPHEPAYWIAVIDRDESATPEQLLESVIQRRQILGVNDGAAGDSPARPGDWICFSVRRKGIVGHAQVDAIVDGSNLIRGAHRFRVVCRLKGVELSDSPIAFAPESDPDRLADRNAGEEAGSFLASVSRETFSELTARALEGRSEDLRQTG
jgi:hypothetical protein